MAKGGLPVYTVESRRPRVPPRATVRERLARASLIPDQMRKWHKLFKKEYPDEILVAEDTVTLFPQGRVAIDRQANTKATAPTKRSGCFDSNTLSGQDAEVREQGGKVIANLLLLSSHLGTRG